MEMQPKLFYLNLSETNQVPKIGLVTYKEMFYQILVYNSLRCDVPKVHNIFAVLFQRKIDCAWGRPYILQMSFTI